MVEYSKMCPCLEIRTNVINHRGLGKEDLPTVHRGLEKTEQGYLYLSFLTPMMMQLV